MVKFLAGKWMDVARQHHDTFFINGLRDASGDICRLRLSRSGEKNESGNKEQGTMKKACFEEPHYLPTQRIWIELFRLAFAQVAETHG